MFKKIFCTFLPLIYQHITLVFLLVIAYAFLRTFWTHLDNCKDDFLNILFFLHPQILDFQIVVSLPISYKPYIHGGAHVFSCQMIRLTRMTGCVVQALVKEQSCSELKALQGWRFCSTAADGALREALTSVCACQWTVMTPWVFCMLGSLSLSLSLGISHHFMLWINRATSDGITATRVWFYPK